MSLITLIGQKAPEVGIVTYFRNPLYPNSAIEFSCGPLILFSIQRFRSEGFSWIEAHFRKYEELRVAEEDALPVFGAGEAKRFLKNRNGVYIARSHTGGLSLEPLRFVKYDLGSLVGLGSEYRKTLPWPCPASMFWPTFDAALADAS